MKRWENPKYQKITNAKLDRNMLVVSFENNDTIEISKDAIAPHGTFEKVDWGNLSFDDFEISVPASPSPIEIPWDKVRVLTDADFRNHQVELAEQQARLIGKKIKTLRKKKGLKSNELAKRANIVAQTLSRIEQGKTDVSFTTLRKLLAAMGYSLRDLAEEETESETKSANKTFAYLLKKLTSVGVDRTLITDKIIPHKIQYALNKHKTNQPDLLLNEAVSYISTIYGWSIDEIWNSASIEVASSPTKAAYYKRPSNSNTKKIQAYTHYAFTLAKILIKAVSRPQEKQYPKDITEFSTSYFRQYNQLDLHSLLLYTWDLGICVLPLNDSGVFHGASWNIEGRHVIILKQNTNSHARWLYDLLHELYHIFAHLEEDNTSVIELEEVTPFSNNDSPEELEANSFANLVIFGGKEEELAEKCIESAHYKLENLKSAVESVSLSENIRKDLLANYLAYRLSIQGENWWGPCANLQITTPDPFEIAVECLMNNATIDKLGHIDSYLLKTALNTQIHNYIQVENVE